MQKVAAALVLAVLTACAGYSPGTTLLGDSGPPIGGGGGDGGDGGPDGGDGGPDGGDAGPDAGCGALTLNGVPAVDGCYGSVAAIATGTVNTGNCTITITFNTATTACTGAVSGGTANAFDGGCQNGFYCTSTSLPGTLNCVSGGTVCAIKICDAGASCP